jgi:hypothetical protein
MSAADDVLDIIYLMARRMRVHIHSEVTEDLKESIDRIRALGNASTWITIRFALKDRELEMTDGTKIPALANAEEAESIITMYPACFEACDGSHGENVRLFNEVELRDGAFASELLRNLPATMIHERAHVMTYDEMKPSWGKPSLRLS